MRKSKYLAKLLADPNTRAWLHTFVLLGGATLVLFAGTQLTADAPRALDKRLHYQAGQFGAVAVFFIAYAGIIARILLVGRRRTSMTRALLWTPALIGCGLCLAFGAGATLGAGKEVVDASGSGTPDWADFDATLLGALTLAPSVAVVMALTPVLIPVDILLQIPRLLLSDVRSGVQEVDRYVQARRTHRKRGRPSVLILEDDLLCAALAMEVCESEGLAAHHVTTVAEAERYLRASRGALRLVILDNFVRVDPRGDNTTGLEWLVRLSAEFPKGQRPFQVVMVSGHPRLLEGAAGLADLVMAKPWCVTELSAFVQRTLGCEGARARARRSAAARAA